MRHRLQHKLFDREKSKSRSPSTFIKQKLHSKSTYFYRWGSKIKNINLSRLSYAVPSVCSLALLVGGVVIINPINHKNQVYATPEAGENNTAPSLALRISSGQPNQTVSVNPGEVAYRVNNFEVTSNGANGYMIFLKPMNGSDTNLRGAENPQATITGVGEAVAVNDFGNNTWGYAVSDEVDSDVTALRYNSIPEVNSKQPVYEDVLGDGSKEYKIVFAAKIGADSPADHYKSNLSLSVVASGYHSDSPITPGGVIPFNGITTMQEMTSEVCTGANIGDAGRLEDTRDHKTYWIAKLKDSNCWMTQNLDLDLKSGKELTPDDSDVASNWDPGADTMTNSPNGWISNTGWNTPEEDYSQIQSFDPGFFVKKNPVSIVACSTTSNLATENCRKQGWIEVTSDMRPYDQATQIMESNITTGYAEISGISKNGTIYDAHYTAGNYYSWMAATAGTGKGTSTNILASDSICPKGWKLSDPYGDDDKTFANLLSSYGITKEYTGVIDGIEYDVRKTPLYIFASGYVNGYPTSSSTKGGTLNGAGNVGMYTTARSASYDVYTYALTLNYGSNGAVNAQNSEGVRGGGQTIRCVAK